MSRLRTRLLLSHLVVALVGAAVTAVVVRVSAPALFDDRLGGAGPGAGGRVGPRLRDLFADAVTQGLLLGTAAALMLALLAALLLGRRLTKPLDDVRAATRRIAHGDYAHVVAEPREEELAALARDVNALAAALRDVEARRVRLLGEVAHEMRTPLTVLSGRVEGMLDGVFVADEHRLLELQSEVGRLRRLADDLSMLSRVEEGRLELVPTRVDLVSLVDGVARRWHDLLAETEVTVTVVPEQSQVVVVADADRIVQVLDNLVGNAVRAVGGRGSVELRTGQDHGLAVVQVRDTGVGLAAEDVSRVFERFFQVSTPGADQHSGRPGSGIGLTVSRGIARAHGGDLTASSPGRGQGATFVVTLPLGASDQRRGERPEPSAR